MKQREYRQSVNARKLPDQAIDNNFFDSLEKRCAISLDQRQRNELRKIFSTNHQIFRHYPSEKLLLSEIKKIRKATDLISSFLQGVDPVMASALHYLRTHSRNDLFEIATNEGHFLLQLSMLAEICQMAINSQKSDVGGVARNFEREQLLIDLSAFYQRWFGRSGGRLRFIRTVVSLLPSQQRPNLPPSDDALKRQLSRLLGGQRRNTKT